ncbi:FKBP-type peptidyl-prolyl cis-trans isomerase [Comamonas thiooxydans]|uniref:FKBP-type peptidyl-prolyl cis-trans isomerase n=1 Tax=Comamonas thiooxydans TaxID=363952 RepID=UPI000B4211F4|nr:FKBP-type peptidyl-prolyl cis-trans isomerase [Comamonas thiooxydans]
MRVLSLLACLPAIAFSIAASAAVAEQLPGGIAIQHDVVGSGAKPVATSRVEVHYVGTLPDGRVFDSSLNRGKTITFPLQGVIPCWTAAVQAMAEGGKATIFCPAATAYGERGVGTLIPPNTNLTFKVQLIKVLS